MKSERTAVNSLLSDTLIDLVDRDPRVIVLNADVAKSVGVRRFGDERPRRFVQMGIAEQDMFLTAAGMASAGLIPVVTTFAVFASLRAAEQIRTFIAYPRLNVKILVSHAGLSPAQDGVTHQATEDVAVMRAIPNMTVIEPSDAEAARALIGLAVDHPGPVYIRMSREKLPILIPSEDLAIGRGVVVRQGADVAIIAVGSMVPRALEAAEVLATEGIQATVTVIHTVKPIDRELIASLARNIGAIVTAEEHNVIGGLGDAVSMVVAEEHPVPVIRVGVKDTFAESGAYRDLVHCYGLSVEGIATAARMACCLRGRAVQNRIRIERGDAGYADLS